MSNPAVVKLCKKSIGRSHMWMDDNFGESIHLHIDEMRADLSRTEFYSLCDDLSVAIDKLIDVEGFHCKQIDPVYFETMLINNILDLTEVKEDYVSIGSLLAPGETKIVPLPFSRCVRALQGDTGENDKSMRRSALIGQTNHERLSTMLESIKEYGYPYRNNYIILYGDDNIIRDGQHRAACLYYLYGDINVPVLRFYFRNYVPDNVSMLRFRPYLYYLKTKSAIHRYGLRALKIYINKGLKQIYHNYKAKKICKYINRNKSIIERNEQILIAK